MLWQYYYLPFTSIKKLQKREREGESERARDSLINFLCFTCWLMDKAAPMAIFLPNKNYNVVWEVTEADTICQTNNNYYFP